MAARSTTRILTSMLAGIAATATLSILGVGEASAVPRACCFADGSCEILSRSECEDQQGGMSEAPGTDCAMADCPVLCGGSSPACNGECPAAMVCVPMLIYGPPVATSGFGSPPPTGCGCAEEIPLGGACDPLADACAPGLSCQDGVCAPIPALAPALSPVSLMVLVGILVALGASTLLRRRRSS